MESDLGHSREHWTMMESDLVDRKESLTMMDSHLADLMVHYLI